MSILTCKMIESRLQIVQLIGTGYNNSQISQMTGHARDLAWKIKKELSGRTLMNRNTEISRSTIKTHQISILLKTFGELQNDSGWTWTTVCWKYYW